jgi:phytoene dehydrogenase-like protein
MTEITVVGGGIAGLVASIACAEGGAPVRLLEAHGTLGGRSRSSGGPFVTNLGPHALYANGRLWPWLAERDLLPASARPPLHKPIVLRVDGRRRRTLPLALLRALPRLREPAPADVDFRTWATRRADARAAELLSHAAGVFTFDHDPGRLSAAFVWERWRQALLAFPPQARFPRGGWSALVERLEIGARRAGVRIETGEPVTELPVAPVIVATELAQARELLDDPALRWEGARTVALDLGLRARRGDAWILWDLDESGWAERFSATDRTLAPAGHALVQAQLGLRPGESADDGERRLEALLDVGFRDWRTRVAFRRRTLFDGRSGALDLPGRSWRDRPAVDRGRGVFLAGDMVAAPGLLSDVSLMSALEAARGALRWLALGGRPQAGLRAASSRL